MSILEFYSYLLILIGISYLVMFFYTLKPRENTLYSIFSLLCLSSFVYIIGAWFQLNAQTVEQINFGQTIKYFGVPITAACWLIFSYRIRFRKSMTFAGIVFVFAIPVFIIMLVATNPYHGLFYRSVTAFWHEGFLLSQREPGSLYYLSVAYAYLAVVFGIYVFMRAWIRSKFVIKGPYFWLLIGGVLSSLLVALYMLGLTPLGLDPLPIGYFLLAIGYGLALFRYNLFDSKQIYDKKIYSEIKEGLIVTDNNGLLIDYNEAAAEVFHWLSQANKGRPIDDFDYGMDLRISNDKGFCLRLAKDEQMRTFEFRITELVENKRVIGRVYIFLDVTDQVKTLTDLNYMVNHDSMTNIYNRRKVLEELESKLEESHSRGSSLSILMMDIDHFKKINDNFGHQTGDNVLMKIIRDCADILRKGDIIGRYGGEEFIVILPNTNGDQAAAVAEKLRKKISATKHHIGADSVHVTISIGVAVAASENGAITEPNIRVLIKQADDALYAAKRAGRNRVVFSGDLPKQED